MTTLRNLLRCDSSSDRRTYQRDIALLAAGNALLDNITMATVPGIDPVTVVFAWLDPFVLLVPKLEGSVPLIICVGTFAFFIGLVWNSVHRLRDAGCSRWLGLVAAIPFLGLPFGILLCWLPGKKRSVWNIADR